MSRRTPLVGIGLLAVTLAACGTTVPQTTTLVRGGGNQAGASQAGADLSGTDTAGDPSGSTATSTSTTPGSGQPAATSAGTTAAGGTSPGTVIAAGGVANQPGGTASGTRASTRTQTGSKSAHPSATSSGKATASGQKSGTGGTTKTPGTLANGPGVTATTVSIGYVEVDGEAAAQAALGSSLSTGDTTAEYQALFDYINKHGGMAGRQITPVVFEVSASQVADRASLDQSACSYFTQDHPVIAILATPDDDNLECEKNAGITSFGLSALIDAADMATYPGYYDVISYPQERAYVAEVNELSRDGYLSTKWDTTTGAAGGVAPIKIGIIAAAYDELERDIPGSLLPALKAKGFSVDASDIVYYSTASDASAVAGIDAAVLQFRSDGVTNILPMDLNATSFFGQQANSQKYYPRIGANTATNLELSYQSGLIPAQQLNGAVGLGWSPTQDVLDSSSTPTPGAALCLKIMTDANIQVSGTDATATAYSICDSGFLLQKGMNDIPSGSAVNASTLRTGMESIGTNFSPALMQTASITPGKHYQVDEGYPLAWDTGCTCAKYTGPGFTLQ